MLFFREKDVFRHEKEDAEKRQWANFNTYWEEKTIDIQWKFIEKKNRINSFKK